MKFNDSKAKDVQETLDGITTLAQQLGINGTPALIVIPSSGASIENVKVILGFPQSNALQVAIDNAAGK